MAQNNKKKTASSSKSSNKSNTSTKQKNSSGGQRSNRKQQPVKKGLFDNVGAQKQVFSCVLFALALFLLCIIVIPSGSAAGEENAWQAIKDGFFGIFGISACTVPPFLFFGSYVLAKDRPMRKYAFRLISIVFGIICLSAFLHVSRFNADYLRNYSLGDQVSFAWEEGFKFYNFGIVGAFFGGLLASLCGKVGAIVTLLILLFVAFMLISRTSMSSLFELMTNAASKIKSLFSRQREKETKKKSARSEYRRPVSEDIYDNENDEFSSRKNRKKKMGEDIIVEVENNGDFSLPEDPVIIDVPADEAVPQTNVPTFEPRPFPDFGSNMSNKASDSASGVITSDDEEKGEFEDDQPFSFVSDYSENVVNTSFSASDAATVKDDKNDEPIVETAFVNPELPTDDEKNSEVPEYVLPGIECLAEANSAGDEDIKEELTANANKLVETLKNFNIPTKIVDIARGPSVTRYEIQPAPGIKISRIASLSDDIAMNLAASGVRIEAPIPNKAAVGIEIPNRTRLTVSLREIIDSPQFQSATSNLNVALGKDISGNVTCTDLAKMPHLLIAGTTGSGKSVCLNAMIISILFNSTPDEVKLIMIDPKQVEFTVYRDIPHLMVPVVSDPRKAAGALAWAVSEMTKRYKMFSEKGVRDIKGYNKLAAKDPEMTPMYQICIFIDELSDLMMVAQNEVEDSICRLAQMARAAGMHLVIATQRPSVNVITGIIKANIPSRIALFVSSQVDSRTIIDTAGAEKLLGNGDMLFNPVGISKPIRLQGCFVSDEEVERVVDFIKAQSQCEYDNDVMEEIEKQVIAEKKKNDYHVDADASPDSGADEETMRAIGVVVENQLASTTLLQRKLKIGYAKAARIMDELEEKGIIGPFEGSKPRKVLMTKQQYNEMIALGGGNIFVDVDNGEE